MNTKTIMVGALAVAAGASQALTLDTFDGNTNANLATQTFSTGAETDFDHWTIGTSGNMSEGKFSVVNKARDVHAAFSEKFDADNDPNGQYAIYNGFFNETKKAWEITLNSLNAGKEYSFQAMFLTLAADPPYPQVSEIRMEHNGVTTNDFTLDPVPAGTEVWTQYGLTFTATGADTLTIYSLTGDSDAGNDFGIDNIEVVPEPATMTLLGLGALAALRRKKKA